MGQTLNLTSSDGHSFDAYETIPTSHPIGALVLVQEIFGVNTHIQATADLYASLGYRVVAVPTMDRVQKNVLSLCFNCELPHDIPRGGFRQIFLALPFFFLSHDFSLRLICVNK